MLSNIQFLFTEHQLNARFWDIEVPGSHGHAVTEQVRELGSQKIIIQMALKL